jgi:transposase
VEAGEQVVEVPPQFTARERRHQGQKGKSDPVDALAIARVAAREAKLPPPPLEGKLRDLRLLVDFRQQLVDERTRNANRLHADLLVLQPGYQVRCRNFTTKRSLAAADNLLSRKCSVRGELARRRLNELRRLDIEISALKKRISSLVPETGSRLTNIPGVGALVAARILGEVGDVRRFPSKSHFAAANGTAPIPASSGRTSRHRVNRGGNRQINRAIHTVVLVQSLVDPRAKTFIQRRRNEGKTHREAVRSLKRHISDVIYRQLRMDLGVAAAA